eukprot:PhF_6_TR10574/c0_g1_i1/m.16852
MSAVNTENATNVFPFEDNTDSPTPPPSLIRRDNSQNSMRRLQFNLPSTPVAVGHKGNSNNPLSSFEDFDSDKSTPQTIAGKNSGNNTFSHFEGNSPTSPVGRKSRTKSSDSRMAAAAREKHLEMLFDRVWLGIIGIATLIGILGEPVYTLASSDDTNDFVFGVVIIIIVAIFSMDFLLQIWKERLEYVFSVYCALDVLSLIDLGFAGGSRVAGDDAELVFFRIMRLGRVAKLSARLGRLVRFFNFVVRGINGTLRRNDSIRTSITNLFSEEQLRTLLFNIETDENGLVEFEDLLEAAEEAVERVLHKWEFKQLFRFFESLDRDNKGKIDHHELQEALTPTDSEYISETGERGLLVEHEYNRRATKQFVLVVFTIFFVPTVWEAFWLSPLQPKDSLYTTAVFSSTTNNNSQTARLMLDTYGAMLLQYSVGNVTYYSSGTTARRSSELEIVTYNDIVIHYDMREELDYSSQEQIVSSLFLGLLLLFSNMAMLRQTHRLLIRPLERTMLMVTQIRRNPLGKIATGIRVDSFENNETNYIVEVVAKLGKLLQVMVGEAGADIISRNIRREGTVSVIRKGAMIEGTFAFFDIRDFTTITEKLQDEVMVFVNHVAAIIHSAAHAAGGFPNKNVGDAFLIVWKHRKLSYIPEIVEVDDPINAPLPQPLVVAPMNNNAVYGALFSCLHAVLSIRNSVELTSFAQALGFENVRVGCGIHHGWAVEGAVGSFLKVDATYLSPHVNLASRLESATKRYGVELMFSDAVYHNIPSDLHPYVRLLDKVALKGFHGCVDVYGIVGDAMYERLGVNSNMSSRDLRQKVSQFLPFDTLPLTTSVLVPNEGQVDNEESAKSGTSTNSSSVNKLRAASLVEDVRESSSGNFGSFDTACKANDMYGSAIRKYLSSDWYGCKQRLKQLLYEFPLDRPAELMLKYIELKEMPDGSAPVTFAGFTRADDK